MPGTKTYKALSPARQRLVALMQTHNYGRIERLPVRGGDPVFDPPLAVFRKHVVSGHDGPRHRVAGADYALKRGLEELFDFFDRNRNCDILDLKFDDGLPCSWVTPEKAGA